MLAMENPSNAEKLRQLLEAASPEEAVAAIEAAEADSTAALKHFIALGEFLGFTKIGCHTHGSPELLPVQDAEFADGGDPCVRVLFLTPEAQRALEDE